MGTEIAYVDETWNPVVGCTKCSPGCENCYAERMAVRLSAIELSRPAEQRMNLSNPYHLVTDSKGWNGKIATVSDRLDKPLHWRQPRTILVPSMGDLFHEKVPFEFINKIFDTMWHCQRHTFLLLTKRIDRAADYFSDSMFNNPQPNIHLGVTICNQKEADEILPIALRILGFDWVSAEPLLGEIDFTNLNASPKTTLNALDGWQRNYVTRANREQRNASKYTNGIKRVVVGCESGPNRRPCKLEWIRSIVEQCKAAGVKCFVKQIEINGKVSHNPDEWPEWAEVRETI